MKYLLGCILQLLVLLPVFSQEKQVNLQGIVMDEQNIPITDVMISVNWQKRCILSRSDGSFYIAANLQDTLVFRHTSFEPKAIALQNINTDTLKVQLTERTLILDEVEVTNWGEWQDFKRKIKNQNSDSIRQTDAYRLEMLVGGYKDHPIKNPYFRGQEEPKINPLTIIGGFFNGDLPQMLYNKYSKSEKIRRKIQAEKLQEIAVQKNAYRYSSVILSKMLKINGDTLKNFKLYCDYLLDFKQTDLKLTKQIHRVYKKWKRQTKKLGIDSIYEKRINYLPVSKTPFSSSTSDKNK